MNIYVGLQRANTEGPVPTHGPLLAYGPSPQVSAAANRRPHSFAAGLGAPPNTATPQARNKIEATAAMRRFAIDSRSVDAGAGSQALATRTRACANLMEFVPHLKNRWSAGSCRRCAVCGALTKVRCQECDDVSLCFFPKDHKKGKYLKTENINAGKRPDFFFQRSKGSCFVLYHEPTRLGSLRCDTKTPPESQNDIARHVATMNDLLATAGSVEDADDAKAEGEDGADDEEEVDADEEEEKEDLTRKTNKKRRSRKNPGNKHKKGGEVKNKAKKRR